MPCGGFPLAMIDGIQQCIASVIVVILDIGTIVMIIWEWENDMMLDVGWMSI